MNVHRDGAVRLPRTPQRKPEPVSVTHIDPRVLAEASAEVRRLSGNDRRRVHRISARVIWVVNQPGLPIPGQRRGRVTRTGTYLTEDGVASGTVVSGRRRR